MKTKNQSATVIAVTTVLAAAAGLFACSASEADGPGESQDELIPAGGGGGGYNPPDPNWQQPPPAPPAPPGSPVEYRTDCPLCPTNYKYGCKVAGNIKCATALPGLNTQPSNYVIPANAILPNCSTSTTVYKVNPGTASCAPGGG